MKTIKTAKDTLREMEVSTFIKEGPQEFFYVDTDEDHVVDAMIVYAKQFIDLAAEEAEIITEYVGNSYDLNSEYSTVDKESILKTKEQIQ